MKENKNVYILNLEAKDLWLANHYNSPDEIGYDPRSRDKSKLNLHRFDGSFSDSLDLTKLKKVYYSVYRRKNMIFYCGKKKYSEAVINVTFKLSVKEFNKSYYYGAEQPKGKKKIKPYLYTRAGFDQRKVVLKNGVCVQDGQLIAVVTDSPFPPPDNEVRAALGKYFDYSEGAYHTKTIPTIVGTRELREWIYSEGFLCNGRRYVRFKRSNGSSRVGKCLFIDDKLYPQMHRWECCGIKPEQSSNFDLAAFEAYIGLTLSSTIGILEIYPENILVVDDYESTFTDKLIVTRDKDG